MIFNAIVIKMTRAKLEQRALPNYSRGEEMVNSISHIVGGVFGVWTLLSCLLVAVEKQNGFSIISSVIYGISMIFLYCASSIYHGLNVSFAKRVFQIIDHCAVFVLIAGSYTPLLLCAVRQINPVACYVLLAVVWAATAVGIVLNSIDLKKYRVFSMACYLLVGWLIVIEVYPLYLFLGAAPVVLLMSGGLCYTFGAILYGIGKKKKYFHSIFHFFVLAGTVLQYFCIVLYII